MDFAQRLLAYEQAAYALAVRVMRDREDARDAVQDAYCRALLHEKAYDPQRPIGPWFLKIVRNTAVDRLRSRPCAFVEIGEQATGDITSDDAIAQQEKAAVHKALHRIPARYRKALQLRYFEGYRYREIAAELCVPIGTAQTLVHRGHSALRAAFAAHPTR